MRVNYKTDLLEVFMERRKRLIFVGRLLFDSQQNSFSFTYDDRFRKNSAAIPLGPDLPLKKKVHQRGELFSSFQDRIPSKDNPAYPEYCRSMGISPMENNPILLLGTIGRRGPSSFIFELVPDFDRDLGNLVAELRQSLELTVSEMALFLEITEVTLLKLEKRKSTNYNLHRLVYCILENAEIARWQLSLSKRKLPRDAYEKLVKFLKKKASSKVRGRDAVKSKFFRQA